MKRIAAAIVTVLVTIALAAFAGAALAGGGGHGDDHGKAAQPAVQSSDQGVKPSNDTSKDTHAQAGSTKTKLYGNGKTAGQIAISKGASPTTDLHGPGNSQPHKVVRCPNGHEVDVHAYKSGASCGSQFNVAAETKTHAKHE